MSTKSFYFRFGRTKSPKISAARQSVTCTPGSRSTRNRTTAARKSNCVPKKQARISQPNARCLFTAKKFYRPRAAANTRPSGASAKRRWQCRMTCTIRLTRSFVLVRKTSLQRRTTSCKLINHSCNYFGFVVNRCSIFMGLSVLLIVNFVIATNVVTEKLTGPQKDFDL
jgi:hypothetical protein